MNHPNDRQRRRDGRRLPPALFPAFGRERRRREREPVLAFVECRVCGADLGEAPMLTELFCPDCQTWSPPLSNRGGAASR